MKKLLLVLLLSSPVYAAKDPIVAEVNGIKIKKSIFTQNLRQQRMFVGDKPVTPNTVIYDLINRELGIAKAKKNNLHNDPVVKRKMEEVLFHAQVSKDLENEFKKIKVSDSDVKKYYDKHQEYRTAHILMRMRANPSDNERKAALEQALKIYQALKKDPSKFAQLANKYSQTPSSAVGGDMGYQPAAQLAPEYYKAIKGRKSGYISSPVRTQFGFHIIKVLGVKEYKDINTQAYKKFVYDQKRDSIISAYFDDLRKDASIKIYKDNLK